MKIKLVKYTNWNDEEAYKITGLDYDCEIIKDCDHWMAVMYSLGDYEEHKVWADTPIKAGNKLLKNYDLKLGQTL